MSAAKQSAMDKLHATVAEVLTERMGTRIVQRKDAEGNVTEEEVGPSAAELAVAVKFLKDNNISVAPEVNERTAALKERLRRRAGAMPSDEDRREALDALGRDMMQ